jgi:hypothetical protein
MFAHNTTTTIDTAPPLWAVLLTPRQRWLLEACVAWHARVHEDDGQRAEFAELTQVVRDARPVHEAN